MHWKKILAGITLLVFIFSVAAGVYFYKQRGRGPSVLQVKTMTTHTPVVPKTIVILPLGATPASTMAMTIFKKIRTILPGIRVAKPEQPPRSAYYPPRQRYRADSLIGWLSRRAGKNETWLGIMVTDISTTHHGKPDWGVMGLGLHPGNACVASSYRMKDKTHFWKVAIHELGHTAGLPHCPVKSCFMRDAEKKNPTAEETEFCSSCKGRLREGGWKL